MEFEPGRHDCATLAADWVWRATGRDPIVEHRGKWSSMAQGLRRAERHGGLAAIAGKIARRAGLVPTDDPVTGDIGVIALVGGGHGLAIRVDRWWAGVHGVMGLSYHDAGAVAAVHAWRVPDAR